MGSVSLRALIRLLLFPFVTAPLFVGWLLTRPAAWLFPRLDAPLQRLWIGSWARSILWIMGVESHFEGPIPGQAGPEKAGLGASGPRDAGAYLLVANHLSYVDIPLLLSRLDARFLAKSEIAGWPVLGFLARSTGTLFVDRSRKRDLTRVIAEVKAVLQRGPGVIVFPEGTSTDGSQVERFKPSLFAVPIESGVPVRVAAIHYHAPNGPKPAWEAVCWWGDAPFGSHFLSFLNQPRTIATVTFSPEILRAPEKTQAGARKALAEAAQLAIERCFTPSRPLETEAPNPGATRPITTL
ncbi:MAG: 1-acyl-sn-glycerol-3-phosphate acyltransferase [Planctomycetota bacterium]